LQMVGRVVSLSLYTSFKVKSPYIPSVIELNCGKVIIVLTVIWSSVLVAFCTVLDLLKIEIF
jgi:hypothetical protein